MLLMLSIKKSMTFEVVGHTKYQEFSWHFDVNIVENGIKNSTEMAYINYINDEILFLAIPIVH